MRNYTISSELVTPAQFDQAEREGLFPEGDTNMREAILSGQTVEVFRVQLNGERIANLVSLAAAERYIDRCKADD